MKTVKHPCIGCVYYKACGSTNRTMPCNGRMTKSQKAKEERKCITTKQSMSKHSQSSCR